MTEAEWDACTDLPLLIKHLRGLKYDRKLRLFACACARRLLAVACDEGLGRAVDVAERFADGAAMPQDLAGAYAAATRATVARAAHTDYLKGFTQTGGSVTIADASTAALYTATQAPSLMFPPGTAARHTAKAKERQAQTRILRCIFGGLFRPHSVDPACLSWNDGAVHKMAQAICDARAFGRLPLLADALEEAGCADAAILAHCRGPGEHVRGCWVVDLLLGKG